MDLGLSDEQHQLVASFANLLAKRSSTDHVRAAEPLGSDPALWASLTDVGAVAMAVPEDQGGWGATMVDLALVAEQLGRALAPAPVIEAQVAARLLAAVASSASASASASAARPAAATDARARGAPAAHRRLPRCGVRPPAGRARLDRPRLARGRRAGALRPRRGAGAGRRAGPGRGARLRHVDHDDGGAGDPCGRLRGAEGRDPAAGRPGRGHHRPRHERARGRVRRRRRADQGPPARRPLGRRRAEDVHHQRARHRLRVPAGEDQPGRAAPPRAHDVPRAARPAGDRGPSGVHAVGRADQHHLLQRRPARGPVAHRRRRRRLGRADAVAPGRALGGVQRPPRPAARRDRGLGPHAIGVGAGRGAADRAARGPGPAGAVGHRAGGRPAAGGPHHLDGGQRGGPRGRGADAKLFSTEALVRAAEDLTELVSPDGLRSRPDPTALRAGRIEHALRFSLGTTIYAGTSEIQRNIIAQRRCDLPR